MIKIFLLLLSITIGLFTVAQETTPIDSCCINNHVPYYYIDAPLKYTGGFYAIKLFIHENYKAEEHQNLPDNTGIVMIHFNISCDGTMKNISLESFNLDYKKTTINPVITEKLQTVVSKLKNWQVGMNEKNEPYCYHKFLAIKLVDSKIIEILPN